MKIDIVRECPVANTPRWRVWLYLAGRGSGKTRSGAEWVRAQVAAGRRRIALVAPTAADARDVIVEGESGILAVSPAVDRPNYEPSKRRLTWPNGAIATTYSADEPERLRGPQHDAAWCDELGAWEAWDMLMFGLRLGDDPRVMVTTTPRPTKLIKDFVADPTVAITGFGDLELGKFLDGEGLGDGGDAPQQIVPESWAVIVECTDEPDQVHLIQQLQAEGRKVRGSVG